uniref:Uncharacterized protein n=2 Tax=Emiliania huxleyi TaxID=2903 RepID=A0A7S3WE03_EMIHU|mmetsp:Transcript_1673/g.5101  ORF Transcript_1673/g.5101 Transcript_1673/m.5101 type:complete len:106 (+) Transcript_1673:321-638(+)
MVFAITASVVASAAAARVSTVDALLSYKGSLVTQIFGLLSCLVLRVYRAMISSPNSDYRTLTEQWQQSLHLALYLVYICGTLALYGACASAAANLGRRPALQVDR